MHRFIGVASAAGFMLGCGASAWAAAASQPAGDPGVAAPAQVVILGTLHAGHKTNAKYSVEVLRELIVAARPAVILLELPPTISGRPTVVNGRSDERWDSAENKAANWAADALGVEIIPFDREGRNELYQKTNWMARQTESSRRFEQWRQRQRKKNAKSIAVRASELLWEAVNAQRELDSKSGPEVINSAEYDMIIATKHGLSYDVRPRLLVAAGEPELAGEFRFLGDEWEERNQIMAKNIVETCRRFLGKRLVVVTGSEHRYKLRALLGDAPEVAVKEYYEVERAATEE